MTGKQPRRVDNFENAMKHFCVFTREGKLERNSFAVVTITCVTSKVTKRHRERFLKLKRKNKNWER